MEKIGKLLKQSYSNGWVKLDGNHSKQNADMKSIREKIARRTEQSLNAAEGDLDTLTNAVNDLKTLMEKDPASKASKGKSGKGGQDAAPLTADENAKLTAFLQDARKGQRAHDANQARKKDFEGDLKKLASDASKLKNRW